jgi:hypothetical protein
MKLFYKGFLFCSLSLVFSCVEDHCKTCSFTSYVVVNEEQLSMLEPENSKYCGEELQELIDIEFTVDTLIEEESQDVIVSTTYITCY